MTALANNMPAAPHVPSPASVQAKVIQREGAAAFNDQATFERLMDDDDRGSAPADSSSDAFDRAHGKDPRDSSDRVDQRSGHRDTADDTSEGSAADALPQAWTFSYPFSEIASVAAPQVATQTADTQAAWSEVSMYLERLLVEGGGKPGGGPAALFTLRADVLVDTAVSLTRVVQGWVLRIDTRDWKLRGDTRLQEAALRVRFAQRGLGELTIELGEMLWAVG